MTTLTLIDVPKDSPSSKEKLDALKKSFGIETTYCRGIECPWMACHMPSARRIGKRYSREINNITEAVAHLGRLLDECGAVAEANTERQAVHKVCEYLRVPIV